MKVDKAVCTTETMTDTENAISYENLLSTLVQKKILAIKRECEAKAVAKQKRKEKNCLGSLIFSNRNDRSRRPDDGQLDEVVTDPSISQEATVPESMANLRKSDNNQDVIASKHLDNNQGHGRAIDTTVLINCAQVNEICVADNGTLDKIESTKCQIDVLNERGPGGNDNNSTQINVHLRSDSNTQTVNGKAAVRSADDSCCDQTGIIIINDAQSTQSKSDNSVIELDIESTGTTTNSKSASIVSQIEVSDEINPKYKLRTRKNSSDTISVPSSMKHTTISAPNDALALNDLEQRHQIHLLEAKSISAQCSPVLTQRQTFNGTYTLLDVSLFCGNHRHIFFKYFPPPPSSLSRSVTHILKFLFQQI